MGTRLEDTQRDTLQLAERQFTREAGSNPARLTGLLSWSPTLSHERKSTPAAGVRGGRKCLDWSVVRLITG